MLHQPDELNRQKTEYKDQPVGKEKEVDHTVLEDLVDLGIFSDQEIEPKDKNAIPESDISNMEQSWNAIQQVKGIDLERVGIVLFKNIFKLQPEIQ